VGIDDIINKAKHLFGNKTDDARETISENVDDAKIDDVAGSLKDRTPDAVDSDVDKIADKAKDIF